jgi:hypothetical protein
MVETFGLLARDHEFDNNNIASKLDKEHIVGPAEVCCKFDHAAHGSSADEHV